MPRDQRESAWSVLGSFDACHRRQPEGAQARRSTRARHAADVRPCARERLQPRRPGRRGARCSTSSPAPVRSGSRRSPEAQRSAVFVERDPDAVRTIERNLDRLRLTGARVVHGDVLHTIAQEAVAGAKYDLVLVDPPYGMLNDIQPRSRATCRRSLQRTASSSSRPMRASSPSCRSRVRTSRKYGQTRITLFEAQPAIDHRDLLPARMTR